MYTFTLRKENGWYIASGGPIGKWRFLYHTKREAKRLYNEKNGVKRARWIEL